MQLQHGKPIDILAIRVEPDGERSLVPVKQAGTTNGALLASTIGYNVHAFNVAIDVAEAYLRGNFANSRSWSETTLLNETTTYDKFEMQIHGPVGTAWLRLRQAGPCQRLRHLWAGMSPILFGEKTAQHDVKTPEISAKTRWTRPAKMHLSEIRRRRGHSLSSEQLNQQKLGFVRMQTFKPFTSKGWYLSEFCHGGWAAAARSEDFW
jgi:hypothetical protein